MTDEDRDRATALAVMFAPDRVATGIALTLAIGFLVILGLLYL